MTTILKRIERAEAATLESRRSKDCIGCICFPPHERPFFLYELVHILAATVQCPAHGDRFEGLQPLYLLHIADWKREIEVGFRWPTASEQYRRAWNASFAPGSWPVEEIDIAGKTWLLPRSETGELLDWRTAQTAPPWKRVKAFTLEEQRSKHAESTLLTERSRSGFMTTSKGARRSEVKEMVVGFEFLMQFTAAEQAQLMSGLEELVTAGQIEIDHTHPLASAFDSLAR